MYALMEKLVKHCWRNGFYLPCATPLLCVHANRQNGEIARKFGLLVHLVVLRKYKNVPNGGLVKQAVIMFIYKKNCALWITSACFP